MAAVAIEEKTLEAIRSIGGDELLARMIRLFSDDSPALLQAVHEAMSSGNFAALAASAHALRSISLNLGAVALGSLCKQIELDARIGIVVADSGLQLDAAYGAARAQLESRLLEAFA